MTRAIVATLPGRIEAATHDRAKRKPTDNMAAYECVLTAKVLHHRSIKEDNVEAQRLLDRAIGPDPTMLTLMPGRDVCLVRRGLMIGARNGTPPAGSRGA